LSPEIIVIGSGEAFDAGLGNTSYLFHGGAASILFDCGYQIPERLWAGDLHRELDAVCFTHLHADHSFGIVPLLVRYHEEKRRKPLHLFGPRGTETYVKKLVSLGYPGLKISFRVVYHELSPERPLVWRKLRFRCARTTHSVLNLTVRVDFFGRSFAVSGDGQITGATRALVGDVGLLLQEVYTRAPEVPVHADLETLVAFVADASVGRIGVAHHSRSAKSKVHARVRQLTKTDRRWFVLNPGMRVPLLGPGG
jgi:phosphoribosyl 1,2-cyclic phosphodiesterase